ncbi:MAG: hypothetical protein IPK00_20715 [Deltaproteobacteria bacterium]|nr:hypothetical protein [Deltaproteobacteria bacterium]
MISTNFDFAPSSTDSASVAPSLEPAKAETAPGWIVATVWPEAVTSASSLPLTTRRTTEKSVPAAVALKQSDTKAQSRPAATRGATSQPVGVFEIRTSDAPAAFAAALIALPYTSGLKFAAAAESTT